MFLRGNFKLFQRINAVLCMILQQSKLINVIGTTRKFKANFMHELEPHYKWRDRYTAENDDQSPFFGRIYSEFEFSNKIYNYFIHPQWDHFGSATLYTKILFADYEDGFAIMEFIGEWNDCINNDIMYLKREVIDWLINQGITRFILIGENVLNCHMEDDCYYEEWYEDVKEEDGWICCLNFRQHVIEEMAAYNLQFFLNFDEPFNELNWRAHKPQNLFKLVDRHIRNPRQLFLTN